MLDLPTRRQFDTTLAKLYGTEFDARRIVSDAGARAEAIAFDSMLS